MQTYLRVYVLYSFNRQRYFGAKYIAQNFLANQKYSNYYENSMKQRGNTLFKVEQNVRLPVVSHW